MVCAVQSGTDVRWQRNSCATSRQSVYIASDGKKKGCSLAKKVTRSGRKSYKHILKMLSQFDCCHRVSSLSVDKRTAQYFVEYAQHKKKLHTFKSGFVQIKEAAFQLFCSSLLFCFRELNPFETQKSILKTWFSILENRNLKFESRNSILNSRKLQESSVELRLSTYL